jgi:D-lactate dehydrogenase (cytochrome)
LNSSNAGKTESTESTKESNSSNSPPSPFWTPAKALLVSAFAAGLGYGVSSYTQTSTQAPKKPQYGSVKDFEKVGYLISVQDHAN